MAAFLAQARLPSAIRQQPGTPLSQLTDGSTGNSGTTTGNSMPAPTASAGIDHTALQGGGSASPDKDEKEEIRVNEDDADDVAPQPVAVIAEVVASRNVPRDIPRADDLQPRQA